MDTGPTNAVLGQLYAEGNGVKRDINAAYRYYTEAIDKEYYPAFALLANLAESEGDLAGKDYWILQLARSHRHPVQLATKKESKPRIWLMSLVRRLNDTGTSLASRLRKWLQLNPTAPSSLNDQGQLKNT
jgi:TPR repeat protein